VCACSHLQGSHSFGQKKSRTFPGFSSTPKIFFQDSRIHQRHVNTLCSKKSDAKIEITITATNLIRIKYPLSSFNYRLSGANIANFNKIHCTVFEQQLFKNGTQKQKFPIWKTRLSSSYTIISVTVCVQSGRYLHRHLHVSCADRSFSAAAGLPVCRPCSVNLPQKSVQC